MTSHEFTAPLAALDSLRAAFAVLGFVRIRGVIDHDCCSRLTNELTRIVAQSAELPPSTVWRSPSINEAPVVQRISRVNFASDLVQQFAQGERSIQLIAAALLGQTQVRFADGSEGSDGAVLVIKDPNNASEHKKLRWHYDEKFTKHLPINPFINLGIYLDRADADCGGLVVVPGSHRGVRFLPELEETTHEHPGELTVTAEVGDIVAHSSALWHCSREHRIAGRLRRVLYFNYHGVRGV